MSEMHEDKHSNKNETCKNWNMTILKIDVNVFLGIIVYNYDKKHEKK